MKYLVQQFKQRAVTGMMKKGDLVIVDEIVETFLEPMYPWQLREEPEFEDWIKIPGKYKSLYSKKLNESSIGIILGYSFLRIGRLFANAWFCELIISKDCKVWVVEPLQGVRYLKPWRCLEEHLEIIESVKK